MGLKYDFGDKSENLRTMNHFEKFDKAIEFFFAENASICIIIMHYYVRILALKIGDNLI